jgi:hypothetical protein
MSAAMALGLGYVVTSKLADVAAELTAVLP